MNLLTSGFMMQELVAEPIWWSGFVKVRELNDGSCNRVFRFKLFRFSVCFLFGGGNGVLADFVCFLFGQNDAV